MHRDPHRAWLAGARRWLTGTLSPLPLCGVLVCIGLFSHLAGPDPRERPIPTSGQEDRYDAQIQAAARRHMPPGWDWRILKAMIRQESNFKPDATSRVGARGLCQMMPATAKSVGVSPNSLDNPRVSIDAGARYLRRLWDRWISLSDRDPNWTRSRFAIASYNAGITRVRQTARRKRARTWRDLRPHLPAETQVHVYKVFDVYYAAYAEPDRKRRPARPSFSANLR